MGQRMCLMFWIIKAANTSKKNSEVPSLILCYWQYNISIWLKIDQPQQQNQTLGALDLPNSRQSHRLKGTGACIAHKTAASRFIGQVWNWTTVFVQFKTDPRAGYLNRFVILIIPGSHRSIHYTSNRDAHITIILYGSMVAPHVDFSWAELHTMWESDVWWISLQYI
jgi:hypothetical protein